MHILPWEVAGGLRVSSLRSAISAFNLSFKTLMESRMTAFSATSAVFSLFVFSDAIWRVMATISPSSICSRWLMLILSIFLLEVMELVKVGVHDRIVRSKTSFKIDLNHQII